MNIEKTGIFVKIISGIELVPEEFLQFALPKEPESQEPTALVFAEIDHEEFIRFCTDIAKIAHVSFLVLTMEAMNGKNK